MIRYCGILFCLVVTALTNASASSSTVSAGAVAAAGNLCKLLQSKTASEFTYCSSAVLGELCTQDQSASDCEQNIELYRNYISSSIANGGVLFAYLGPSQVDVTTVPTGGAGRNPPQPNPSCGPSNRCFYYYWFKGDKIILMLPISPPWW